MLMCALVHARRRATLKPEIITYGVVKSCGCSFGNIKIFTWNILV